MYAATATCQAHGMGRKTATAHVSPIISCGYARERLEMLGIFVSKMGRAPCLVWAVPAMERTLTFGNVYRHTSQAENEPRFLQGDRP